MAVTNILPGYTFGGHDAYEAVPGIVGKYGKKVCIIGGKRHSLRQYRCSSPC